MAEPTYIELKNFASNEDPTIKNLKLILSAFNVLDFLDLKQAEIMLSLDDARISTNTLRKSPEVSEGNSNIRMSHSWGISGKNMLVSKKEADKAIEEMIEFTKSKIANITKEVDDFKASEKKKHPEILDYLQTLSFDITDRIDQLLYDISSNLFVANYSDLNDYLKKSIKDKLIKLDPSSGETIESLITRNGKIYVTRSGGLIPASIMNLILARVDESLVKKNMALGGNGNIGERVGHDTRLTNSIDAAVNAFGGWFKDDRSKAKFWLTVGSIVAGMVGFFAGGKLNKTGRIVLNSIVTALSGALTWMDVQDILNAAEDDPVAGLIISLVFDGLSTIYAGGTLVGDLLSKIDKAKILQWSNSGNKFKMQLAKMCSGKGKELTEKVCLSLYNFLKNKFPDDKGLKAAEAIGIGGDVFGLGVDYYNSFNEEKQKQDLVSMQQTSASAQLDQALLTLQESAVQEHPEWYTASERNINGALLFNNAIIRWNPELDEVVVTGHKGKLGSNRKIPLANGYIADKPLENVGHFTLEYLAGDPTMYREYTDGDPEVLMRNLTGLQTITIPNFTNPEEPSKPSLASKMTGYLTNYMQYLNNTPLVDNGAYNFYNEDNLMIAGFPDRLQAADWYAKQMSGFGNGR